MAPIMYVLDICYGGLFWSRSHQAVEKLENILGVPLLDIYIYVSPELTLAVAIGDEHAESIISWFQKAHQIVEGSSVLAGILTQIPKVNPPTQDCYLIRISTRRRGQRFMEIITKCRNSVLFLSPTDSNVYVLAPSYEGLRLCQQCPDIDQPFTGLVFRKSSTKKPLVKLDGSKAYDPILAQVTEVVTRSYVAVKGELEDLRRSWNSLCNKDPRKDFADFESILDEAVVSLRSSLSRRTLPDKENILRSVDRVAHLITDIGDVCSDMRRKLRDYNTVPDPLDSNVSYAELLRVPILNATNEFAKELLTRSEISAKYDVISVFDGSFTAVNYSLSSITEDRPRTKESKQQLILTVPRHFQLRIGGLPMIAHPVADEILQSRPRELEWLYNDFLTSNIFSDSDNEYETLNALLSELRSEASNYGEQLPFAPPKKALDEFARAETLRTGMLWFTEIFADLLATCLAGPAFLYSMTRFSLASLSEFMKVPYRPYSSHPPFARRVKLCLEFLEATGFDVSFNSEYLDKKRNSFPKKLAEKVLKLVKRPYLPQEHERSIKDVKLLLSQGKPVEAPPTLLLNALWDAVVNKGGYVNEIALLLSLA